MAVLVLLTLFVTCTVLLIAWMKKSYSLWKDLGVPYEEPHLIFGNLKGVKANQHEGELIAKFYRKFKGQGPIAGLFMSLKPVVLVLDMDLMKSVFVKDFNTFHDRGFFTNEKSEPLSVHLFALKGQRWRNIRQKLTPIFTSAKLKSLFPVTIEVAKKLELKIDSISELGGEFDPKDIGNRYTIDAISTCTFGFDCGSVNDSNNEFYQKMISIFLNPRNGTMVTFLQTAFRDYAELLGFKYFRDDFSEFFTTTFKDIVDFRLNNNVHNNDFTDMLMKLYTSKGDDHITYNEFMAQALTIFVGAFETTSSTIQFCCYELAKNPDIQDKLRNHMNEVLERFGGELTYEAVLDMKYADQVINEAIRMYPPLASLSRVSSEDYKIPKSNITLKKGTCLLIPVHAIHYDPEFYPDPHKFNPDRFSPENREKYPAESFLGFGIGPKQCIGGRLGMMQVKLGLFAILRKHKIVLSPKTKIPLELQTRTFATQLAERLWIKPEKLIE